MTKKYVDVICLNDKDGNIKPLYLLWDEFTQIPILKVKEVCPNVSLKQNETGLMYTCIFNSNKIRHIYYDRGKWYVKTY